MADVSIEGEVVGDFVPVLGEIDHFDAVQDEGADFIAQVANGRSGRWCRRKPDLAGAHPPYGAFVAAEGPVPHQFQSFLIGHHAIDLPDHFAETAVILKGVADGLVGAADTIELGNRFRRHHVPNLFQQPFLRCLEHSAF